ncbi:MAG: ABC transporter permease subunit [Clostridiales bacterium]|nr:ABC transporter permease subunit [Clostridiales bacterium]
MSMANAQGGKARAPGGALGRARNDASAGGGKVRARNGASSSGGKTDARNGASVGGASGRARARNAGHWGKHLRRNAWLYVFLLIGLAYLIVFKYIPMAGIVIAFEDYNTFAGILGSPWVGLQNFKYLFSSAEFGRVLRNSVTLSLLRLLAGFPAPLLLALLLNEIGSRFYKRAMQTILYLPHFVSWVVIYGILLNLLSPSTGLLNYAIAALGGKTVSFLTSPSHFSTIVVLSDIWKNAGWGTIVYLAAISGINPAYYEAAIIDGASRFKRIAHITLPMIAGTVVVMLILRSGSILNNGFEQIFLLQNALNADVSEVFETYTYKVGLVEGRFPFSTAVGLFQSAVGLALIMITNFAARKAGEGGLW